MTTAIAERPTASVQIEQALIGGDLSKLTPAERVSYYNAVCSSLGLNPLTKPFAYITLNGKLTLYALKDCTEQLRSSRHVSVTIAAREAVEDCYVVTARATLPTGRADESIGAVNIAGLKGEARANALMKAETKAKRRVTLSICGLGMLDETEVASITHEPVVPAPPRLQVTEAEVVNTEDGEVLPELPEGVYYVTAYHIDHEWHEASILKWDAQGGALRVSTKRAAIGNVLARASNEHLPVTGLDVTARKNSPGQAYVNKVALWVSPDLVAAAEDVARERDPLTDADIPF